MNLAFVFNFGLKSTSLLVIIIQLLILVLLFSSRKWKYNYFPDQWLAAILFIIALFLFPWMLGHAGWYAHDGYREFLYYFPFHHYFIFGPLIYKYVLSITGLDSKKIKLEVIHWIPGLIYLLWQCYIAISDLVFQIQPLFYSDYLDKDFKPWYQITGMIYISIYIVLSLSVYFRYKKAIYNQTSYADSVILNWVRNFLLALLIIVLLRIFFTFSFPENDQYGYKFWYYLILGSVGLYVGISGYIQSVKMEYLKINIIDLEVPEPILDTAIEKTDGESIQELHTLFDHCKNIVQNEKLFQNNELNLSSLAKKIGVNSAKLSKAINHCSDSNFNDFINAFRVDAVIENMNPESLATKTILGLAYDQGFNSKSTFIRAFKKKTGRTPSEYLKNNQ